MIKAKYIIPSCKHVFLIDNSKEDKKRKEYFENIFYNPNDINNVFKNWKIKKISENDFLSILRSCSEKFKPSKYYDGIEILCSNLPRNQFDYSKNPYRPLDFIPDEDILEIFI